MADVKETRLAAETGVHETTATDSHIQETFSRVGAQETPSEVGAQDFILPEGWMYRTRRIGSLRFSWYASPRVQLLMVSFVCFLCPGMYNALQGLGGAGKADHTLGDKMNTAVYSTFAVVGFFAGTFVNRLGVKLTLGLGGLGYCIYTTSLLVSLHADVEGFNIFAGALLGICAGLLWAAQGQIMLSYPTEAEKGKFFAWFWAIFNLGGVLGSLIPLGQNINVLTNTDVGDGTYIGFIVLMFLGACVAFLLIDAQKVIRSDGSHVIVMAAPSWKSEFIGLYQSIRYEPWIILLFPMFWVSNWFTTYQTNSVNGAYFDTRTKSLNGLLNWLSQILGALLFGYCLDIQYFRRTTRAKACLVALLVLTLGLWGGGYAWQLGFTRENVVGNHDWSDSGYAGPMFLYMAYGFYDSCWQCSVYWYMGALSNSGRKAANFVGFYKGLQSAGAAVMWAWDSTKPPFMSEFASNWALLLGSLVFAAPVIFLRIKDHVPIEDDLRFTDETLEDVLPAGHPEKHVDL